MPQATIDNATAILTSVVKTLVSRPECVFLDAGYSSQSVALTLLVSPQDLQAVVGENGRTSRSLRAIVAALAKKSGFLISLEIKSAQR